MDNHSVAWKVAWLVEHWDFQKVLRKVHLLVVHWGNQSVVLMADHLVDYLDEWKDRNLAELLESMMVENWMAYLLDTRRDN
jgi:hypothetical protein